MGPTQCVFQNTLALIHHTKILPITREKERDLNHSLRSVAGSLLVKESNDRNDLIITKVVRPLLASAPAAACA